MGDGIQIDQEILEADAQLITDMSLYFKGKSFGAMDMQTTISANANGKNAYSSAQVLIETFGEAMDREAKNIRELGLEFKEFDETYANLNEMK